MPGLRFVIHDRTFQGERIWIRSTLRWTDKDSGEPRNLAATQVYRVAGGKLAETWLISKPIGSAWSELAL